MSVGTNNYATINSIAFGGINAVYKDDFCNDFEPKDNK